MATSASNPTKKAIRNPSDPGPESQSGRKDAGDDSFISLSRDDIEFSGDLSGVYRNYNIHISPTPNNQPEEAQSDAVKTEQRYMANCIFTGGFNSETRAVETRVHFMNKVVDSVVTHPQMAGYKGISACAMPACDRKLMTDERGKYIHPCVCRFKICRDCYIDALMDTGNCPGCKEPGRPLLPLSELPNQKDQLQHLRQRRRSPHLQGYGGGGELREYMGTVLPQTRHQTEKSV